MLIIEKNLAGLVKQYNICSPSLVENFCLKVLLGDKIYYPKKTQDGKILEVVYDHFPDPHLLFEAATSISQNLELQPGESVLACSSDMYCIPKNCFGLLQTKGTLARLFVSITCNDGQVEPGFEGRITLEITNNSPWKISLPLKSNIGQLYLFRCTTTTTEGYSGRYALAAKLGPTIPIWSR